MEFFVGLNLALFAKNGKKDRGIRMEYRPNVSLSAESAMSTFHGLSSRSYRPDVEDILKLAEEVDRSEKRRGELRLVNEQLIWNEDQRLFEDVVRQATSFEFTNSSE